MESKTLGGLIRARREEMGLTQTDLAERAGVGRGYLAQVETNRISLPTADFRRRIAAALGIRHVELLLAAGELTETEIGEITAAVSHPLVRLFEQLPPDERQALFKVAAGLAKSYGIDGPQGDQGPEEEDRAHEQWIMSPSPRPCRPGPRGAT